jgi:aspartyl-tRNA(Asn)/glutamyl-tRNA(Gln) amidotransferase subunit C
VSAERTPLDRARVEHVARLASLQLTPDETDALARDLAAIVAYVEELAALDTTNVPATSDGEVATGELRPDEERPGLTHDEALSGAPRQAHGGFAVPAFVE